MNEIDFKGIEEKWQKRWEGARIFEVSEDKNKKKFYCLEMFPYPSADGLHMGHALNYVIGDVLARFKTMQGFNVLHPMGYDALGLPAENAAIKAGVHPEDYTNNSIKNYIRQQKGLGISYDWKRIVNTASPGYYKWDQWIFLKMFEKGLAYQKEAAVNWCPLCNSVLANEQVHNGKCWRHEETDVEIRYLKQWYLKISDYADELYESIDELDGWPNKTKAMQKNWIGKSHGTEINFEINNKKWPIFTTRPDTLYGVTFMVISAQHNRLMEIVTDEQKPAVEKFLKKIGTVSQKSMKDVDELNKKGVFTGAYAVNPINNEKVPIYAGNFVVADYGSGMVMAVPAHDQRDFEFAKKYDIEIKQVIKPDKYLEKRFTYGNTTYVIKSKKDGRFLFNKNGQQEYLTLEELKIRLKKENIKNLQIDETTLLLELEKIGRAYTDNGILINSKKFDGIDNIQAIEKITDCLESKGKARKVVNFRLRDWLISRQRFWGTPIPIIHCEKCGVVPVPEKDLPVKLPRDVEFGKGNPLLNAKKWLNVSCPNCGKKAKRESDTMDTFVNSSWYFLRYCDSNNDKKIFDTKKAEYWCPIDQYIGGSEHACMHLIYSRFYTKFLADLGLINFREPAIKLFHQGMLHGEGGIKMSKSKGNVINPEAVSEVYGIDTARYFLLSLAEPDKQRDWNEKGIQGSLRFIKGIFKFFEKVKIGKCSERIEVLLNKTIKEVSEDIDNFRYRMATIKLKELFEGLSKEKEVSKDVIEKSLKILSPICPHIAEELWEMMGEKGFVSNSKWPCFDESKLKEKKESVNLNDKVIDNINDMILKLGGKGKEVKKIYVYAVPFEIDKINPEKIKKKINVEMEVFAVNDKKKYDPENKAKKAKPGMPSFYVETENA